MDAEYPTIRLVFCKTGRARYISHLDLNRAMTRAVRRAGVPLWYTEGFNRHPYITFSAPLSLGFESNRETMDLRLVGDWSMEQLTERLNAVMPEGLRVLSAAPAQDAVRDIASARYRLDFSCAADAVREVLDCAEITVEKKTKKGGVKLIDLKPLLTDTELAGEGICCSLTLTLPCGSENTANPSLLCEAVQRHFSLDELPCAITRLGVYTKSGKLFC